MQSTDKEVGEVEKVGELPEGWLPDARTCMSPNYDDRPAGIGIDMLVIHNISLPPEQFSGHCVEQFFCNQLDASAHPYFENIASVRVSSHLFIRRDGELIQFVPLCKRAWHAGVSRWEGRERCNDFSIGIELEGSDNTPFEEAQYRRLIAVSHDIMRRYPAILPERIVGHSDIAPSRKTDPGPHFDWPRFRAALDTGAWNENESNGVDDASASSSEGSASLPERSVSLSDKGSSQSSRGGSQSGRVDSQ